ncbi:MAG TPA: hypothetical protein VGZ00_08060 [Candidatus Baltobacteraceae bacterium]|jgi:hypothetical protein|nr:hypothetical protein [Candidatus Baltobacteraceae bacterium]
MDLIAIPFGVPGVHALDDLLQPGQVIVDPIDEPVQWGNASFEDAEAFQKFVAAQRIIHDRVTDDSLTANVKADVKQRWLREHRELLEKLKENGRYPPLLLPEREPLSLDELLTPTADVERGGEPYRAYGRLLVARELVDDFERSCRHVAASNEPLVCAILSCVRTSRLRKERELRITDWTKTPTSEVACQPADVGDELHWNRTILAYDTQSGARVPPAVMLFHEFYHWIGHRLNPFVTYIKHETPHEFFTNHEEESVITGPELTILRSMGRQERESHATVVLRAENVISEKFGLSVASGDGDFVWNASHALIGVVVEFDGKTVTLQASEDEPVVRYRFDELTSVLMLSPQIICETESDARRYFRRLAKERALIVLHVDENREPWLLRQRCPRKPQNSGGTRASREGDACRPLTRA